MRRRDFPILKFVAVLVALITPLMSTSNLVLAEEEGRIQITFSKPDGAGAVICSIKVRSIA